MLLAWGPFRFEAGATSFEELRHRVAARWKPHEIIGRAPAGQFLGEDAETIHLKGTVYPRYTGDQSASQIRDMQDAARKGDVNILLSGSGEVFGSFYLKTAGRDESFHEGAGQPQKLVYDLEFVACHDGNSAILTTWP